MLGRNEGRRAKPLTFRGSCPRLGESRSPHEKRQRRRTGVLVLRSASKASARSSASGVPKRRDSDFADARVRGAPGFAMRRATRRASSTDTGSRAFAHPPAQKIWQCSGNGAKKEKARTVTMGSRTASAGSAAFFLNFGGLWVTRTLDARHTSPQLRRKECFDRGDVIIDSRGVTKDRKSQAHLVQPVAFPSPYFCR